MNNKKNEVLKLRLQGLSYSKINKKLGVSKSTLSSWLANLDFSEKIKEKLKNKANKKSVEALIKRNKNQTLKAQKRVREIRLKYSNDLKKLSRRDYLILGVSLYWAEGYKRPILIKGREVTNHPVSLTNSDAKLIVIFLKFLRDICLVENRKIKANLRIFEHQNEKELLDFWIKITGIEKENFGKTYVGQSLSSKNKRPFNRLEKGVIQVVVSDTKLFHKIMGYIEGLGKFV